MSGTKNYEFLFGKKVILERILERSQGEENQMNQICFFGDYL